MRRRHLPPSALKGLRRAVCGMVWWAGGWSRSFEALKKLMGSQTCQARLYHFGKVRSHTHTQT